MTRVKILLAGLVAIFLIVGLTPPCFGDNGSPPIIILPVPPGGTAGSGSQVRQASPDSQRFRPETPGQKIKENREKVKEYKAVPPPAAPEKKSEQK